MRRSTILSVALAFVVSNGVLAQERPAGRRLSPGAFLQPDASEYTEIDFEVLRRRGFDDLLERFPFKLLGKMIDEELGFDSAQLRRRRSIGIEQEYEWGMTTETIITLECVPTFRLETSGFLERNWYELEKTRVSGVTLWVPPVDEGEEVGPWSPPAVVEDGQGFVAIAPVKRLTQVLDRSGPSGMPAELTTLHVGPGRALLQAAGRPGEKVLPKLISTSFAPDWPFARGTRSFGFRAYVLPEDPRVHFLVRVRYAEPGKWVEGAAESVRKGVAGAMDVPAYAIYRPVLKSMRVDVSRQDLEIRAHVANLEEAASLLLLSMARTAFMQLLSEPTRYGGVEPEWVEVTELPVLPPPPPAQGGGGR